MLERVSRLDATKAHFIDMERRAGREAAPESKSAKRRPPFGSSLPNSLARLSRPTEHLGSRGDGRWRGQNSAPRAAAAREPPSRVATPSHREAAQTQATHRCNRCFRMICSCTPTVHKRGRQNNEPAALTPIPMVRSDLDIDWSGSDGSMRCWVKGSVTVDTPEHPSPHVPIVRCEDVTMDTPERPAPDTASPGWNDGRQANVTIDNPRSPGSPGANLSIASPSWSATTTSSPAAPSYRTQASRALASDLPADLLSAQQELHSAKIHIRMLQHELALACRTAEALKAREAIQHLQRQNLTHDLDQAKSLLQLEVQAAMHLAATIAANYGADDDRDGDGADGASPPKRARTSASRRALTNGSRRTLILESHVDMRRRSNGELPRCAAPSAEPGAPQCQQGESVVLEKPGVAGRARESEDTREAATRGGDGELQQAQAMVREMQVMMHIIVYSCVCVCAEGGGQRDVCVYLHLCLCISLSCLSIYLSVYLSIYLSIYRFIYIYMHTHR